MSRLEPGSPEWYAEAERLLAAANRRAADAAAERWDRMSPAEQEAERREVGRVHRPIAGLGRP